MGSRLHSFVPLLTLLTPYISGDEYTFLSLQDGDTPLMIASFNGHVDVVHVLIEACADVHSRKKV